ncbi:MAG: phosphoribosylamine--glycine ligase [Fimbriimonadaceae bacterium]
MRVLVVGSGGREHALVWKLSQEAEVFATPGNPGIAAIAECFQCGLADLVAECLNRSINLVIVGPESPLIDGLADRLRASGIAVFGPGADGARLEASKAFSKEVMARAGVPTADSQTFTDFALATEYCRRVYGEGKQLAIKASGAALGKGVVVCSTFEEAFDALDLMMVANELGDAGRTVVCEERLFGREFSLLAVCNGNSFVTLPIAQDYKRALDGDRGPNTGGMGTYSPVNWVSEALISQCETEIIAPALCQLAQDGIDYRGVLFAGVMVQEGKPYCLEYNVRFGDPETQTVVRRIESGFLDLLNRAALGLSLPSVQVSGAAAITVVMASGGYPGGYEKGSPITLPNSLAPGVEVFHAGTIMTSTGLVSSGGRVLGVSATGSNLEEAREKAYATARQIEWKGSWFRSDVGLEIPFARL